MDFENMMKQAHLPKKPESLKLISSPEELGPAAVIGGISLIGGDGYMCPVITLIENIDIDNELSGWSLCLGLPGQKNEAYYFSTKLNTQRGTEIPNAMVYFIAGISQELIRENADQKEIEKIIAYVLPHISDEGPPAPHPEDK
jgi:hypothetical protein